MRGMGHKRSGGWPRRASVDCSVHVSSFSFENCRSFADLTAAEIRPLILLFGYNSAGKSAAPCDSCRLRRPL